MTNKELREDRDYWLHEAKRLQVAYDKLADKLDAIKKVVVDG